MQADFAQRVKEANLTKQEQQVAEKIIRNLSKSAFSGGPQLAKACGVSASAITRFAQKLGYSGFPELKIELEELFRHTITPYEMFKEYLSGSRRYSVWQESLAQDVQNMMQMQNMLEETVLDQAVTTIEQGRQIYSAAITASQVAVHLLHQYLGVLGKSHTGLIGYGISKQIEVTEIGQDDVLIAICSQRIFREVRDVALFAKQRGARTIAITDSMTNALAVVCDLVLIAPVTGATFGYSQVAPIAMVNMLVNSLAARNPEDSLEKLERVRNRWNTSNVFCSNALPGETNKQTDLVP